MMRAAMVVVATPLLLVSSASGQSRTDSELLERLEQELRDFDATYRLEVPPDQPISERLLFEYGGSMRFGFVSSDRATGSSRTLRQTNGLLYLRAELDGAHRFYGRLNFRYDDFNAGDSFDRRGDELENPIGDRYWYQFDLRGAKLAETGERIANNVTARVGRQYEQWGAGLALSEVLYSGVVDVELNDLGITGLAGVTPASAAIDFDTSRAGFDGATDRAFFGGRLEYRGWRDHRPYLSALVQRDRNDDGVRTFESTLISYPTRFEYDSEYFAIGSQGTLGPQMQYRVEFVYETGDGLSSSFDPATSLPVTQTREDIDAWAGLLALTYLLRDEQHSRFDLEFAVGSGDDDRLDPTNTFAGNTSGTDDTAFNSLGYVNTGLALAPELSNLMSLQLGFSTAPLGRRGSTEWLRLGVSGFLFAKTDEDGPISVATTAETFVGGEIGISVDWRIASDVAATARYGVFLPGDAIPGDQDQARHFLYMGVSYAF
ncbi:MAG: alginate export family protein [Phycisphaerales bacterium]|nr:alginate export family protein [Phycisphaerales bacterium]NNM25889.1 alginate export family protein [Phycisphaerales bacterium]